MSIDKGTAHQYGQAIAAVILAGLLSIMVHKVTMIEDSILHKDYVELRFSHIEYMIEELKEEGGNK